LGIQNLIGARHFIPEIQGDVMFKRYCLIILAGVGLLASVSSLGQHGATKQDAHAQQGQWSHHRAEQVHRQSSRKLYRGGETRLYAQDWEIGTLDPVRERQWSPVKPGEVRLEHVPLKPVYTALIYRGDPNLPSEYNNFQVPEDGKDEILVEPHPHRPDVSLFIDLGRTAPGTVEFEADVPASTSITFETGEALLPTRIYGATEKPDGTRKHFRPAIANGGWGSMRFVWINFHSVRAPFTIRNVHGVLQIYPSNYVGNFACSDEELMRIWEMCAYSAHAVMGQPNGNDPSPRPIFQTLCLDRVDRFPWAGDSRVIQTAVEYVFGQYWLIRAELEGFLPRGTRPIPNLNTIPGYTLDWALALVDYYRVSGDAQYLKDRLLDLRALVEKYDGPPPAEKYEGSVNVGEPWLWFDWDKRINDPFRDAAEFRDQRLAAFEGKYIQTCRELAWAAESVGELEASKAFWKTADRHAARWLQENENWSKKYYIHAITNLLLGKTLGSKEYGTAFKAVYADRIGRCSNTPYFGIYILNALALMGRHEEAVEMLHDYWGTMISAGATTTWEEWNPTSTLPRNMQPPQYAAPVNRQVAWGGLSLIQPAGVGPARWLLSEVVGITPERPGFRRVRIHPHSAGLAWARGSVATPLGPISVEWNDNPDKFLLTLKVPTPIEGVTIVAPRAITYDLDEKPVKPSRVENGLATIATTSGEHRLVCTKARRHNGAAP
jgi:hypothetical protein